MGMCRNLLILWLCCCTCCMLGVAVQLRSEEPADAKLQQLADKSRRRAESILVSVAVDGVTTKAKVCPNPLMKYTDVPRLIEMATLWVWQDEDCPVALGKVEAYRRPGGPKWLYCFTSTSTGLVRATWPDDRRFEARKPGIEWAALDAPAPQETAAGRRRQMKELFHRFSATTRDDVLKTSDELRPLARPLHEYSAPGKGVLQGMLCGFAANGTNPDVIVLLEAVGPAESKPGPKSWRYAVVGMTAGGVSVKIDKVEIFTRPYVRSPGDLDTWTYFWEGAPRKPRN
jgi:hypothetical protein